MWLPFFFSLFFFLVAPTVTVDNQIVGVPLGNNVTLGCIVESSPKSINVWYKDGNKSTLFLLHSICIPHSRLRLHIIIPPTQFTSNTLISFVEQHHSRLFHIWTTITKQKKTHSSFFCVFSHILDICCLYYQVTQVNFFPNPGTDKMIANSSRLGYEEKIESSYRVRMILTIGHFRKSDVGKYECRCRNELGEAEGTIKLHGVKRNFDPPRVLFKKKCFAGFLFL